MTSSTAYAPYRARWLRAAEPSQDPLSEADLSLIWQGQRFPPEALTTADGRAVEVVHPGRRGGGAGPDFLDAVVRLDGVERRGDVELHVRASSFRGHGHDRDPAYANLALHVVYEADEAQTRLPGGGAVPVAAFAPWLTGRAQELQSWLQAPEMWQEPCRDAVARLGEAAVRAALEAAGLRRFAARAARMASEVSRLGPEEALWRSLVEALGAGGDREGFRRLGQAFPAALAARLRDPEAALAYVAGLGARPDEDAMLPEPVQPGLRAYGRPANRPQLRLAGLAALLRRAVEQYGNRAAADGMGPLSTMAIVTLRAANPGTPEPSDREPEEGAAGAGLGNRGAGRRIRKSRGSARRIVAAWSAPPAIGAGRAQELLVNAVLPFAAAQGLQADAAAVLAGLPAPAYGKTAFLESHLRPEKGRMARTALQSQGLLGYVAEWCSRGGCGRCPLSPPGVGHRA